MDPVNLYEDESTSEHDMSRLRILKVKDGPNIRVQATDPYGLWHIKYDTGLLPHDLKGEYTSFDDAKKAIDAYLMRKQREIEEEKLTIIQVNKQTGK